MQHFVMFPPAYSYVNTSCPQETSRVSYEKVLETMNDQSLTIKKLNDELLDLKLKVIQLMDRVE